MIPSVTVRRKQFIAWCQPVNDLILSVAIGEKVGSPVRSILQTFEDIEPWLPGLDLSDVVFTEANQFHFDVDVSGKELSDMLEQFVILGQLIRGVVILPSYSDGRFSISWEVDESKLFASQFADSARELAYSMPLFGLIMCGPGADESTVL